MCGLQKYASVWALDDFISLVHRGLWPTCRGWGRADVTHLVVPPGERDNGGFWTGDRTGPQESSSKLWGGRAGKTLPSLLAAILVSAADVVRCWSHTPEVFPEASPLPPPAAWLAVCLVGGVASALAAGLLWWSRWVWGLGGGSDQFHLGTTQTKPASCQVFAHEQWLAEGTCFPSWKEGWPRGSYANGDFLVTGLVGFLKQIFTYCFRCLSSPVALL